MRAGAFDYVITPFSLGQIDVLLRKAESFSQLVKGLQGALEEVEVRADAARKDLYTQDEAVRAGDLRRGFDAEVERLVAFIEHRHPVMKEKIVSLMDELIFKTSSP